MPCHYDVETLQLAYQDLKRDAAPGVDGVTWKQYGENLEGNLQDLSARLRRGAYRAKLVRRAYIPKADGRQRPRGVTTLEDKLVQRAVVWGGPTGKAPTRGRGASSERESGASSATSEQQRDASGASYLRAAATLPSLRAPWNWRYARIASILRSGSGIASMYFLASSSQP